MPTVGILALQGDFAAHRKAIDQASGGAVRTAEVRTARELADCNALVLPGGESSTMLKLLDLEGLFEPLREFGRSKPIFGTCAGAILLAREVSNPAQRSLGLVDIAVERNAYGRQLDSRVTKVETEMGEMEAVFIRAPIIRQAGKDVRVVASYQGTPVWIEQGLHTVTTFHPELSQDLRVQRRFLQSISK